MRKIFGLLMVVGVLVLFTGCLLVPSQNLPATLPPTKLADSDSQFVDVRGLQLHYKKKGNGKPFFLLLHGFGASVYSWRELMDPLSAEGSVIAYDRPAFGLTERPLEWREWNPYSSSAQVDIALELLDLSGAEKAILVGNSAGGTLAAQIALQEPERVEALVLVSPAIYETRSRSGWLRHLLRLPFMEHIGLRLLRANFPKAGDRVKEAWHDKTKFRPEFREGYELPLKAQNWDIGLWNFMLAREEKGNLIEGLKQSQVPTLILSGDDDRIVPTASSVRLAGEINAELQLLEACGHLPQEECPGQFLASLNAFLANLPAQ